MYYWLASLFSIKILVGADKHQDMRGAGPDVIKAGRIFPELSISRCKSYIFGPIPTNLYSHH